MTTFQGHSDLDWSCITIVFKPLAAAESFSRKSNRTIRQFSGRFLQFPNTLNLNLDQKWPNVFLNLKHTCQAPKIACNYLQQSVSWHTRSTTAVCQQTNMMLLQQTPACVTGSMHQQSSTYWWIHFSVWGSLHYFASQANMLHQAEIPARLTPGRDV